MTGFCGISSLFKPKPEKSGGREGAPPLYEEAPWTPFTGLSEDRFWKITVHSVTLGVVNIHRSIIPGPFSVPPGLSARGSAGKIVLVRAWEGIGHRPWRMGM